MLRTGKVPNTVEDRQTPVPLMDSIEEFGASCVNKVIINPRKKQLDFGIITILLRMHMGGGSSFI